MTSLDGDVDVEALNRLAEMVGEEKRDEIVLLFLENAQRRLSDAQQGRSAGDSKAVSLAMHSLRSSAELIGATELSLAAGRLEDTLRKGHEVGPRDWERLERAWDRVERWLRERG